VKFHHNREVYRIFSNLSEASYEDTESILQLELIYLNFRHELGSKFKRKEIYITFIHVLKTNICISGERQLFMQACSEALTYVN